jgi:hypothetical protein
LTLPCSSPIPPPTGARARLPDQSSTSRVGPLCSIETEIHAGSLPARAVFASVADKTTPLLPRANVFQSPSSVENLHPFSPLSGQYRRRRRSCATQWLWPRNTVLGARLVVPLVCDHLRRAEISRSCRNSSPSIHRHRRPRVSGASDLCAAIVSINHLRILVFVPGRRSTQQKRV